MNAHALLTAQGWRGHGHSLHKTDDSIGLAKPLLLNRKDNTKGLGVAQHFNNDQWWLSAFDEQLKGLEMTESGGLRQTVTTGKLNAIQKGPLGRWSVYTSFVKGGFLDGTMGLLSKDSTESSTTEESSDESGAKTTDDASGKETMTTTKKKETKEERRARKEARRKRKEERAKAREARRARKEAKKEAKAKGIRVSSKDGESREEKGLRREKKEKRRRKLEEEGKKKAPNS